MTNKKYKEIEEGFEQIMVFLFIFLVLTSLVWLLLGNRQIPVSSTLLIVFGIILSGVITWFLYNEKEKK